MNRMPVNASVFPAPKTVMQSLDGTFVVNLIIHKTGSGPVKWYTQTQMLA